MKALELLKELTVIISTSRLFYENETNFEFTKAYDERIYKAIEEIKTLQQELKQGQDNYNKLWDIYSELKKELGNRTCKSCKYSEVEDNVWKSMRCRCDKPSIMPYEDGAIYLNIYEDFCCNQYEPKENK